MMKETIKRYGKVTLISAIVGALLVRVSPFTTSFMPDGKSLIIHYQKPMAYKRGDKVLHLTNNQFFCETILGVGNDEVRIDYGSGLWVNGKQKKSTTRFNTNLDPLKVPEDSIFTKPEYLVKKENIIGKVVLKYPVK